MNSIAIILAATLLLNCVVLSYVVFVLLKKIRTLEQTLNDMQTSTATRNNLIENVIAFILLTLLSTQQGINMVFSLLSNQDEIVPLDEPHKNEMKIH